MNSFRILIAIATATVAARGAGSRPNFVVIMAEAQGWAQTSVMMDDRVPESKSRVFLTPAVERLAREGMRFTFGYAASPRCTPSRAALFTGKSPAALHMTYVGAGRDSGPVLTKLIPPDPVLELPASETTVAEILKPLGYATAHFGKWHVGRVDASRHGFDESDGPTSNGGPENVQSPNPKQAYGMTERGIAFMARAQKAGKPPESSRKRRSLRRRFSLTTTRPKRGRCYRSTSSGPVIRSCSVRLANFRCVTLTRNSVPFR